MRLLIVPLLIPGVPLPTGTTLHSALGLGIPRKRSDFRSNMGKRRHQLRELKVLIIDEISMISAEQLELMDSALRDIVHDDRPFAGIQLVLSGDFAQLPPVQGKEEDDFKNAGLAFDSLLWEELKLEQVLLRQSFRHSNASRLEELLGRMRSGGEISAEAVKCIRNEATGSPYEGEDGVRPTELYARNAQVDDRNKQELKRLKSDPVFFKAADNAYPAGDTERTKAANRDRLLQHPFFTRDCLARDTVQLKEGAQVMCLKNLDLSSGDKIVNGSRGQIIGFTTPKKLLQIFFFMEGRP